MSLARAAALALSIPCAACGNDGSSCGPSSATVSRIVDGDTVELDTGVKIRYLMINAPETTNGHNDCYGQNATWPESGWRGIMILIIPRYC